MVEKDGDPIQKCFLFCSCDQKRRKLFSLSNFYTMEFSPIFSSSDCRKDSLLSELAIYIANERPAWHYINFRLLIENKEPTELLCSHLRAANFMLNRYYQFDNYFVDTRELEYSDYYKSLPSRLRHTIIRKRKKLERLHSFSASIFSSYEDLAVDDYMEVYARSWKDREMYPKFIPELCRLAAQLSVLRMGILYIDSKPVASQIWLLSGRKAIIYKLAYDEVFKAFSVGSILTNEMAKVILKNDRVEEIDYGIGSEPYKKDWIVPIRL